MTEQNKLAILVGGGPAPGINSVIGAATIRARLEGIEVLGLRDGFEWVMKGDIEHVTPLTIDAVSRIHFRGGSHLGISRANPTLKPESLENTVTSLLRLDVTQLITIGGDDTAYSAMDRVTLELVPGLESIDIDLLALDEALSMFATLDPRAAQVVELRFFGGYTDKEVSEILGESLSAIRRDWTFARSWLKTQLKPVATT